MNRRDLLASAAATATLGIMPTPSQAADIPALVEAVMSRVVPYRSGFVAVKGDDLRALCEAVGVEYGEHFATRRL
ncbi:hypothetical protein ROJ8625_00692 [Roseivivax jejudonensis]|uniref:Twin-arginine translocation signal domain-containing protein n=1 Tax=Roseivivax jejudonensis TaxID=1529041 RepID=A0A1X6YHK7_9RHOB|nr:hypothetical protein [Roseivivax jejudonensis]SLN19802.1 hypothetical protein ROJ8625_00692 [Roseivivax jejudonensis]